MFPLTRVPFWYRFFVPQPFESVVFLGIRDLDPPKGFGFPFGFPLRPTKKVPLKRHTHMALVHPFSLLVVRIIFPDHQTCWLN